MGNSTNDRDLYKPNDGEVNWGALVSGNFDELDAPVPHYDDVSNAPDTDGFLIYITGDGATTPEGLYQRQSGSYVHISGSGAKDFGRVDVTSTSATGTPWDSAWVDTSAAGGDVTYELPPDGALTDGDRVDVGVVDATHDTDVTANTGQSIVGDNPTIVLAGSAITFEYKASTSTWMVR